MNPPQVEKVHFAAIFESEGFSFPKWTEIEHLATKIEAAGDE